MSSETVGATFKVEENLPSFLFSEDNVNSKKINFSSLSFNRTFSNKTKLKGYTFFNFINQHEFLNPLQNFYTSETPESLIKKSVVEGKSNFTINKIELEHKENENSYYNYLLVTNYSNDKQNNNLKTISFPEENQFNERNTVSNFNVGQKFLYKRKIASKTLFDLSLYNELTFSNSKLQLQSDTPFLNLNFQQDFSANQKSDYHNSKLGFNAKITTNGSYGTCTVKGGASSEHEKLTSFLTPDNSDYNFESGLYKANNYIGLNFKNKRKTFFNFLLGLDVLNSRVNFNSESKTLTALLPAANLTFDYSKKLNFGIGYRKSASTPQIRQMNEGLLLENYRTIADNSQIDFSQLLHGDSFTFNSSFNDFNSGINSFISAIYTKNDKAIGSNSQNSANTSIRESRYIDLDNSFYLLLMFEKKFTSIPWSVKLSSLQSRFEKENYVNNTPGIFKTTQNKTEMEFISYFKSNRLNFNFGCEYIDSHSSNKPQSNDTRFYRLTPYINTYGVAYKNKFTWSLNSKYLHYQASGLPTLYILDLSPAVTLKHNHWIFTLGGNNVLNLKNNNEKTTIDYNTTYSEETTFSSLSGYLNFGAGFSF